MIPDDDITSDFENFSLISFCRPYTILFNEWESIEKKIITLNKIVFSMLCDGYLKRLVSLMEWPAEIKWL